MNRYWLNLAFGVGAFAVGWLAGDVVRTTLDENTVLRFHNQLEASDKQGYPAHWGS